MTKKRLAIIAGYVLALVILAIAATTIGDHCLDGKRRPACGLQHGSSIGAELLEKGQFAYPNLDGDSAGSMAAFFESMGGEPRADRYRYIPGLRTNDPEGLVLLYMVEPTRYESHLDDKLTIWNVAFRPLRWSLVGPSEIQTGYHGGEQMDQAEFKRRIAATLDFLESQQRPGWEKVVAEHRAWLAQLD